MARSPGHSALQVKAGYWSCTVGTSWHRTPSPQESRFHILSTLLVGSPLVKHFLLVKRIFQSLSAPLMNMYHIPPLAVASSQPPFTSKLLGLFLFLFLSSGANTASVFVFVFNRFCSKADSSFSCVHFYNRMGCPRNTLEDSEILKTHNIQRFS